MLYALNENGQMVHVDSVPRGLACNCICPFCHAPLEAKQGTKKIHSFAHAAGHIDCMHGYETGLHLRAKQIIEQEKKICLPAYNLEGCSENIISYFCTNDVLERKGTNHPVQVAECVDAESEVFIPEFNIKPDVLVHLPDGKSLMVEIFVTHAVDLEKQANIEASGISAIEIDFSQCDRNMTDDELRHYLCESAELTHWCYNAEQDDHNKWYAEWNKNVEKKKHEVLTVDQDFLPVGTYLPFFWDVKTVEEWIIKYANYRNLRVKIGANEVNNKTFVIMFNATKGFCKARNIALSDDQIKSICTKMIKDSLEQANIAFMNMQLARPTYSPYPRVSYQKPMYNKYRGKKNINSFPKRRKK